MVIPPNMVVRDFDPSPYNCDIVGWRDGYDGYDEDDISVG